VILTLCLVFFGLMLFGVPIAFTILGTSLVYVMVGPVAPSVLAQRMLGSLESFPLLAIPFFVVAGSAMARGGIAERLYDFADSLVGHLRGGLAQIAVVNSLLIGSMSGSANADAAIDARTIVPIMRKQGYDNAFGSAIAAASGVISPIMPPSIGLLIYGLLANVSVGQLFMGGVVPAFLIAFGLMTAVAILARQRGYGRLRATRASPREVMRSAGRSFFALLMPVLLLVGLRIGVFTPTELGAIAAVYALLVGLVIYRGFPAGELADIFRESAHTTANVLLIVAASAVFSVVIAIEQIPQTVVGALLGLTREPWLILLIINVALLILGTIMESLALLVILAPLLVPVIADVGIDPVHFGVVFVFNLTIGSITPPVGTVLYTVCSITGCSIEDYTRALAPLLVALVAVLAAITFIPELVLALPRMMF
jgi:tripartite ATP-independent transporter DctM subunit